MPASEQVVVRCDHEGCLQLVTFERTVYPTDKAAIPAFLAERGWGVHKDPAGTFFHCTGHARELAKFFGLTETPPPA